MEKYLAFDGINNEFEFFDNLECAQKWLCECFFDKDEGYHPDLESCAIFKLHQEVECKILNFTQPQERWQHIFKKVRK